MASTWQPTAPLENLHLRAKILKQIRYFFEQRGVLEVDTPLLGRSTVTDPHLHSFETDLVFANTAQKLYLQTSPEYAMKRLLAAGSGSIYQICKAFRNGEQGRKHNPEFTMLEWYRVGMDHWELMAEVDQLIIAILGTHPSQHVSYKELFEYFFEINPHTCQVATLIDLAKEHGLARGFEAETDKDFWLDLLLTHIIEPTLGVEKPVFVYDYPESQAALAKTHKEEEYFVGERFELYFKGLELANGYHELYDAKEQLERFNRDNALRKQLGRPSIPIDSYFLDALPLLPPCSGVALGIDRLVSLAAGTDQLADIIAFSIERA